MRDPRIEKLAQVLVHYSTQVQPGQLVRIMGDPVAMPLLEAVYEQVVQAGAHPVFRCVPGSLQDLFFEYASEELRNDKEIFDTAKESLMEVVKRSGYALEYVSEELKNDKEMVLAAVREDGSAIKYASEELKNDPEFMKEVEQYLND